ncbi:hypothetical protein COOONC_07462 [Cooperia oncophora]
MADAVFTTKLHLTRRELLKFAPTEKSGKGDLTSKFSLYLLGQLMYGTVLIYDRQVTLFERDARSTYKGCMRLPMEELLECDLSASGKAKKRQRDGKKVIREHNPDIDIDEEPNTRMVPRARPCDITMVEAEPLIWHRQDVFFDEENRQPVDLSVQGFINWNDLRSRGSSSESVEKVEENPQSQAVEPVILDEFPPLPPPEAFANVDRETFMAGSYLDLTAGQQRGNEKSQSPPVVVKEEPNQEPAAKRPRMDDNVEENPVQPNETAGEHREAPAVQSSDANGSSHPSLELSAINKEDLDAERVFRRRRNLQLFDTESTVISYETMKERMLDYSSLIKTKEELRAGMTVNKYPTLHELLLPYPAYAGKRFPKECIELYQSMVCDKMTYQQALTEDLYELPDRGPASKLWRDPSDVVPGIAFLTGTPQKERDESQGREGLLTPSKISIKATPDWYKSSVSDERQSELSLRVNDVMPNEPLQMAADVSLQENARVRESRGSYVEEERRMTIDTNEFDRRPSSVQLMEPFKPGDTSGQSFPSSSGRISLPDSLKEKFQREECRCLLEALSNASGYIPLSSIIPNTSTSRKRAVGVFSSLLSK